MFVLIAIRYTESRIVIASSDADVIDSYQEKANEALREYQAAFEHGPTTRRPQLENLLEYDPNFSGGYESGLSYEVVAVDVI